MWSVLIVVNTPVDLFQDRSRREGEKSISYATPKCVDS